MKHLKLSESMSEELKHRLHQSRTTTIGKGHQWDEADVMSVVVDVLAKCEIGLVKVKS